MNKKQLIVGWAGILILSFVINPAFAQEASSQENHQQEVTDAMFYQNRYILILRSTRDYNEAVEFATKASKSLGLKFDNEYIKYSKEKGIYLSEDFPDEAYRGEYWPRRYSGEYISLENSGEYGEGFMSGYIIIVAGIYDERMNSEDTLRKIKGIYKDAYIKKANMWMGCIH